MSQLENLTPEVLKAMPLDALPGLAASIRAFLIENIARTGGHIGANLGVVELSIALHYVFDSPADAIIWDTGHQGYTHKILTGRAGLFPTLNTYGGMNRFVSNRESPHDRIEASHAGTSLSMALGMALGRRVKGAPGWTVPVIGDGALCEGMALEALNHIPVEPDAHLVVVLNDNGYAISPGFGAIHNHLQSRRPGDAGADPLFASLGYRTIGPVDGHDPAALIRALEAAKAVDGPVLVHVKTEKGHGYPPTAAHPFRMHFSFPFDVATGAPQPGHAMRGYQDVAGEVVAEEMERNPLLAAVTPSTLYATGLARAFARFPQRCFDPGMEEQHAMTLAAGLAKEGLTPVAFFQSTFMQRAFDQLFHDVCFPGLPVLLLTVRSGFAGYDNPTHHGIYDLSYLRCLPNLRIYYPKDGHELARMIEVHLRDLRGPVLIHMPYGPVDILDATVRDAPAEALDRPETVREGTDAAILAVGNKVTAALDAARRLEADGVSCAVVNLRRLKPLPDDDVAALLRRYPRTAILEEGVLEGGVGAAVAALACDRDIGCRLLRIGLECVFAEPGSNQELCRLHGVDGEGVARRIRARWFA